MKIKGLTSFYLAALRDDTDPLHSLVKVLSTLDPTFSGKFFQYIPQDVDLFFSIVNLASARAIASSDGIVEMSGYPFYVQVLDLAAETPTYLPGSDDDGSQLTWSQWTDRYNYSPTANDSKNMIGDLGRFGLSLAESLIADGFEVIDRPAAKAIVEASQT